METREQTTTVQQATLDTRSKSWTTTETTVASVPDWPHEARALKKKTWTRFVYIIGDILLVLLPIYFICRFSQCDYWGPSTKLPLIVLGVAVVTLNGKPTKDNQFGKKVETAIQLVSADLSPIIRF